MTDSIATILEKAAPVLADWRPEHTPIQLAHFVIGNHSAGTVWGAYVQSMRELSGRVESLRSSEFQLEELQLAVREAKLDREDAGSGGGGPRGELAVDKAHLALRRAEASLKAAESHRESARREVATVLALALQAREAVGELTEERRLELEWEFWATSFAQKIAFLRASGAPISDEIALSIPRFPERHRNVLATAMCTKPTSAEFEQILRAHRSKFDTLALDSRYPETAE